MQRNMEMDRMEEALSGEQPEQIYACTDYLVRTGFNIIVDTDNGSVPFMFEPGDSLIVDRLGLAKVRNRELEDLGALQITDDIASQCLAHIVVDPRSGRKPLVSGSTRGEAVKGLDPNRMDGFRRTDSADLRASLVTRANAPKSG